MNALPRTPTWRLWIAPVVWALHFLAIYGFTALSCARPDGPGSAIVPAFVITVTIAAVAVLGATIVLAMRDHGRSHEVPGVWRFVHGLTSTTAALVIVAVVWEALPVLLVPVCL